MTAAAVLPKSVEFNATQYLIGSTPTSLDTLTNWRYETRLHVSAATLPNGASRIVGLGSTWLTIYRSPGSTLYYSLILRDGVGAPGVAEVYVGASTDIFVRAQRNGSSLSLKVWSIDSAGTLAPFPENSGTWTNGATLSPGFSLGVATQEEFNANGYRWPFTGQMAFFRFYNANADNSQTPNLCDSATALIRYEFENNLTNAGTASASVTPTGSLTYQPTPGTSCATGGTPSFTLVSGAQSPASITPGQAASFPLSINRQNFTGSIGFGSCTGPAGVTCSASATAGNSVTVNVTTSTNTPVANHQLGITGTAVAGGPSAAVNLPLVVVSGGGASRLAAAFTASYM